MNEAQKLLMDTEAEYESTETESAPSGEWAEYNVHYLQVEARYHGMLEIMNAIGTCCNCKFRDDHQVCDRFHADPPNDGYCEDFEMDTHEIL